MSLFALLAQLRKAGIRIWQENGELKFKAPIGAMTPELKDQVRSQKDALIDLLKRQETEPMPGTAEVIPRRDRSERLPLSASQEALWVIDQLSPEGHEYNIPVVLRLEGELDVEALGHAVATIVQRHEILRTRYGKDKIGAHQIISEDVRVDIPVLDVRGLVPEERQTVVQETVREVAVESFDLQNDLMLRARLIRLEDDLHLFAICTHHIASDGGSLWILTQELSTLYTAQVTGKDLPLSELPVQYADFAHWQRQWLAGEEAQRALAFWENTLDGIPDVHNLPFDRPRPARQSFRGKQYRQFISGDQVARLDALAKERNATTFMVLHAALAALLYRYSHDPDIVIGTPIANRNLPEQNHLVGFFANTLVLRSKVAPTSTFEGLLAESKAYLLAAYENQQLPFETLVDAIQPERSLSGNALFQVMLVLQNNRQAVLDLPGLTLSIEHQDNGTSKFDLTLLVNITNDGFCIDWEYATDLFDEATIARMSVHFALLLDAVTADPGTVLRDIPLQTSAERRNLLEEWNATKHFPVPDEGLHQLFGRQVAITPEAPAMVHGETMWTYEALNTEANRLAHILVESGVTPDDIVALCIPRSPAMLAAILAILKAGAGYLPLDAAYADSVILKRLASAMPLLAITDDDTDGRLASSATPRICLGDPEVAARLGAAATTNPAIPYSPDQLAYVLSTSGSTGEPKLIGMPHRPLANLIAAMKSDCPQLDRAHAVLQFASIGFDMSFTDMFLAWLGGGKLCLMSETERTDLGALADLLRTGEISVANLPYSLLQTLAHYANVNQLRFESLEVVISTAERLLVTDEIRKFFERHPRARLVNHFGPSETHVCTSLVMDGDPAQWHDMPSIGSPLANVRCYVLDEAMGLAPVGVAGELYVGGAGLARGYLNLPELSRERFLDDPFAAEAGARMYQTGDTVRWLDNGELQYLGRSDTQVKLRGFRIELSEVETALLKHPSVSDAVVTLDEGQQLAAFVVADGPLNPPALKEFLREQLPEYMLPGAIALLDILPLNTNGKVDRKALPKPDFSQLSTIEYASPTTENEKQLCGIWEELLAAERVGLDDNFFDIGGHSLLATRLSLAIRDQWQIDFPVRGIFEKQTVRGQVSLIEEAGTTTVPPIGKLAHDAPRVLSFTQQRLWLLTQLAQLSPQYNMPAVLTLDGDLDREALQYTLDALLARHETLRTVYRTDENGEPYPLVLDIPGLPLAFVDLAHLPEDARNREVTRLAQEEAAAPFDLAHDLMVRASLIRLEERSHTLLVTMHHIASDGWSIAVMTRESSELYTAFLRGEGDPLSPLTIDYADFAAWQKSWMSGEVLESHLDYWKARLGGIPTLHNLPLDKARPVHPSHRVGRAVRKLPKSFANRLNHLAREHDATLFMVLSAAYAAMVARHSGDQDVVFGTPIANRERAELTELVGFFVNTLVLRVDLSGPVTFSDLLQQSKARLLEAYEHQQLPFDKLVDELQPERSLSYSPLFQLMLVLQNNEDAILDLPGLSFRPMEQSVSGAKYDLLLNVNEDGEGLSFAWEYAEDLFERQTVELFAERFEQLLGQVLDDADARLDRLFPGTEEELARMSDWAGDSLDGLPVQIPLDLFHGQADARPDAVALQSGEECLSYRELEQRANRIAHALLAAGYGKGSHIGLCVARGFDLPAVQLATWKIGAVHVPIDPEYPRDRIAYIASDARLDVLVTDSANTPAVDGLDVDVLLLNWAAKTLATAPEDRPSAALAASDPCYVIYTSGSTGNPKGVVVEQGALGALLASARSAFAVGPDDAMPALASYSFDISLFEMLLPLVAGGRCVLLAKNTLLDMARLCSALENCTLLHAVPALMNEMVLHLIRHPAARPQGLRRVFVGGDKVPRSLILDIKATFPAADITELYGPTEATILSTYRDVSDFTAGQIRSVIGRPFRHVRVHVLDENRRPCPVGVPGELYVGGRGVAMGYLGRDELSEEKFPRIDICENEPRRVYATGDRVRWLQNGELEFLGRMDNQVKVRGHRIELGEIEARLEGMDGVDSTVVTVLKGEGGNRGLVAWLQPAEQPSGDFVAEVRARLAATLPSFMVPQFYEVLPAIPLTANGKYDRRTLENRVLHISEGGHVPPFGETEVALCAFWQELLDVACVGATDNFFELGGHSLLVSRLVAWIRTRWSVDVSVKLVFENQTVRQLAHQIETAVDGDELALVPVNRDRKHPLSFAQQRLWLLDQIEPGSTQYNMTSTLDLDGDLDVPALNRALDTILERHDVLRTVYVKDEDGSVWQKVKPHTPLQLARQDLSSTGVEDQANELEELVRGYAAQTFALERDLMFQAALVRLAPRRHTLIVSLHHIAYDGWSMGVIVSEMSELYSAYVAGKEARLPELAIQYVDYSHWQRNWLQGQALESQIAYWKEELSGIPAVHNLPLDRPRKMQRTFAAGYVVRQLEMGVVTRIQHFAQQQDVTFFMVVNAVLACLLSRYSGESDIVIGCPIANREQAEVLPLVGYFANTIVLRNDVSHEETFSSFLKLAKQRLLRAYEHQQVPFEQLVDEINPERSLSHAPLFQVMLAYQNNNRVAVDMPGLTTSQSNYGNLQAKYDITLNLVESREGLELSWEYAAELFDEGTVRRMARHFENLLAGAIATPDAQIGRLPLLGDEEVRQIVHDWNNTKADFPQDTCLHHPFEAQALRTPNAVAVVFGEKSLTYRELNEKANRVAHHLIKRGIEKDELVAICVERSLEMVIGLLAILKAGAAYVPLDPRYPIERKHRIVEKARIRTILADEGNLSDYSAPISIAEALRAEDGTGNPDRNVRSTDRAYVIFTSGSTGEPKGVVIAHQSAVNLVTLVNRRFSIGADDTVLCITSVGFDLSVYDIFGALACGARLIISAAGDELEPLQLLSLIEDHCVTFWDSVPSTFSMLVDYIELTGRPVRQETLRLAFLSGDWIPTALPGKAVSYFPNLQVIALGGATEGTVWSNFYPIESDVSHLQSVPYGRPLDNNTFYVLDKYRQPVPLGVAGELYIGGAGVAQGYLNDPEKTTASFVENPYHPDLNFAMYRTGDLGRILPTAGGLPGNMEFLGRRDHQLKIRGFRVELGDIESCLRQHDLVKEVVIIASEPAKGLVAYFTSTPDIKTESAAQELRRHALVELPEYMVPACFIKIDALPLSGNGKIDRKALPKPDFAQVFEQAIVAPENPMETRVLEIWKQLLGLTDISVVASFFDVGGQSLLATRLAAEIYCEFSVELSIRMLFQAQTIREQAKLIERQQVYLRVIEDVDHLSEAELDKYLAELSEEE